MLKLIQTLRIIMLGFVLLACTAPNIQPNTSITASIETLTNDMSLPHEGKPHGVPSTYNWVSGPRVNIGNDPGEFSALIAWGHLYEDASGNPASNTRVQIRDMTTYILSRTDGTWHQVQKSYRVNGRAFREDYLDNLNQEADIRNEPDGSISVTAGNGYNFHFWPTLGRVPINPNDIAGVVITVEARLILDNPKQVDDRSQARYLLGAGGDYWSSLDAGWDSFKTNGDIGIGRFKYVREDWQIFSMSTVKNFSSNITKYPLNKQGQVSSLL